MYSIKLPSPVQKVGSHPVVDMIRFDIATDFFTHIAKEDMLFLVDELQERVDLAQGKYPFPLSAPNGRNFRVDMMQEILDAINYARGYLYCLTNTPAPHNMKVLAIQSYKTLVDLFFAIHRLPDVTEEHTIEIVKS